jgi:hypothetical protein
MSEEKIELTIRVTNESLTWAVHHINNYIASQPHGAEPLAHAFVSALTNPVAAVTI